MRHAPNPFWRFSLRVYRSAAVQEACLTLQEQHGADVNLLLWCGWVGLGGRTLDKRHLQRAMARVGAWQSEVIAPLRKARRALKQLPPDGLAAPLAQQLRRRIAAIEIDLEHVEQAILADLAAQWPAPLRPQPPRRAVTASMARYLALLSGPAAQASMQHVATLCDACCASPGLAWRGSASST